MKYTILATFEFKNKMYVYYTYENMMNMNILYGYFDENGNIKPVDDNEKILMDNMSKNIFISKDSHNHVKLGITRFNGKVFQMMYDKVSGLKFFHQIDDGDFCSNDICALFLMFNTVEYCDEKKFKKISLKDIHEDKPFIKKYAWFGKVFISITIQVTAMFLGTSIGDSVRYSRTTEIEIEKLRSEYSIEYSQAVDKVNLLIVFLFSKKCIIIYL